MQNIEYYQLLIIIAQCIVVAAFLLLFFRLRTIFGLGLFYIAIGLFKFMHYFFTQAFSVEIASGIHILIGPTVITPAILFALLLIYIREDAGEVRKIIYALIFFNFFFAIMLRISALGMNGAGFVNKLNLPEHFFRMDIGSIIAGSLVLFIDGIVLIVFYEFISKKISSLLLRIFFTMTTVIFLHSLIFNSAALIFRSEVIGSFQGFAISILISKAISISVYTIIFWLYIIYFERRVDNSKQTGLSFRDLFNMLTYRQKYALTHDKLKESEEKFRTLVEESPVGIFLDDSDGNATYINDKCAELIGVPMENALNMDWIPYIHIDDKDRVTRSWVESITKRKSFSEDYRWVHPDGKVVWTHGNITPVKDKKGDVIVFIGTLTDITERKQAEEALIKSQERYQSLFDNSPIPLWEEDFSEVKKFIGLLKKDGVKDFKAYFDNHPEKVLACSRMIKIKDVNNAVLKLHKAKSKEDLLSGLPSIFTDKSYEAFIQELIAIAEGKGIHEFEGNVKTLKGKEKEVHIKWMIVPGYEDTLEKVYLSTTDITERNKAKVALKEAQSNLQALLDNRKDSIWSLDRNYNFIVFNKPYADVIYSNMGVRLEKGMNALDIHPKEVADFWKPKFDEVFQGKYVTFEFSHVLDGKEHFFEVLMNPIYTDNKVSGLSALSMNITERKQTEKELTKLSTAVTQSPSVIAITDTEGKLDYVNPKFTEITGYSLEEAKGQNPRVLKSGEHSDEMYKELWETITSGKVWRGEFHNKKKNGELFWEMALVSPVFDEQGKIINYIKVAEDITGQKRNEQIQSAIHNISNAVITSHSPENFLSLVKEELGKLIDTTNFYVALYDEKTDRISLPLHHDENDKWESYPVGKTLTHYVIKTGKSLLAKKAMIEKLIKSGEVEQVGHLSEVWLGVPLKSENKITGIFAVQSYDSENAYDEADLKMLEIISHQISISLERLKAEKDLKLAKEKAEESNRLKTAFLNNMSHEIRTPLNGITGFISLLQDSEIEDEAKQEFFDIINKSSDRLIATVTDIMDISRIEAGEVKVTKTEVSVNEILEEQYKFFYQEAKSKGIELNYKSSLSDREARIITDKHKLEGILTNLIKNAIKFTDQGEITFFCSLKKEQDFEFLEFYVKDTGVGIPANRIEAIFNRFEQADIADTRAFQGSGLGLAITKSYVEMLGGKISVKSKEGEGSTFTFSIPYTKPFEKESDAKENIKKELRTSLSHLSLIIVEDDEVSRLFLQTILENKFNKIIYTATGKGAIDKCRENPETDIILMDIKMPDMNGYDATREIRKFNKDVVIIAQTAYGILGDKEKALDAGCNDYISKPINKELLMEKIMCHVKN